MPAPSGNAEARLWLFDFDNTLAALEKQVDWRRAGESERGVF